MNSFKNILIFLLSLISYVGNSQYLSNLGRFEVSERKGCAPLSISINNLESVNCNPCDVTYGDGTLVQNTYTHTYNQPGIYTIQIDYQSMNPRSDFFQIEVVENISPDFEIYRCSNSSATIEITDTNFDQYAIDFDSDGTDDQIVNRGSPVPSFSYPGTNSYTVSIRGQNVGAADNCNSSDNTFQAITELPISEITAVNKSGENSIQIQYDAEPDILNKLEISVGSNGTYQVIETLNNGLNQINIENDAIDTESNVYCFRINSTDLCTNQSVYSAETCTLNSNLDIQDGRNSLTWNSIPNTTSYTILRNGISTFEVVEAELTDRDIICGTEYCYTVIANFTNGGTSSGYEQCGTAFTTQPPDPVFDIETRHENDQIILSWKVPENFTPEFYSITATKGTEVDFIESVDITQIPFIYNDPSSERTNCFQINYTDICGNSTVSSTTVCSIQLKGNLNDDNSINLNWNAYKGYTDGVENYRIEKYDKDGGLQDTFFTNDITFKDDKDIGVFQILEYRIYAVPSSEFAEESYSNSIRIIKRSLASHPDIFTPDGDGLNDEFLFYGSFVQTFNIRIYNRWGELVFFSNRIDRGWDGTYRGEPVPSGSYTFNAQITDLADRTYSLKGIVALVRN